MMRFLRYFLFPFSVLYGAIVRLRHWAYDCGLLKSVSFNVPTICVGNLSVGGTGKTPMVEYLIRNLLPNHKVGVVSRGYKRKTKGLVLADEKSTVFDLGDEPFQFWRKFPEIILAVDSNRVSAVQKLIELAKPVNVVILDDAFQHRKVCAKKNVLLTSYGDLFTDDCLLPTGNLRDVTSRASQTDVIVVTKCPIDISKKKQEKIRKKLHQKEGQKIVFSKISYAEKVYSKSEEVDLQKFLGQPFVLVTGIANPRPLLDFLNSQQADFTHLNFPDHHHFTVSEIEKLRQHPRILTTEKDFVRLQNHLLNVYYLPIQTTFISEKDEALFWQVLEINKKII